MTLNSYDLRDPDQLIREIGERVTLTTDTAFLVLIEDPSDEQRIVTVRPLETPALIETYDAACDELREVVESWPVPDRPAAPRHMVLTILVRPGLCVFGPNESCWFSASRYSNHVANMFDGGIILVTEHGWQDFMTGFAGHAPALVA